MRLIARLRWFLGMLMLPIIDYILAPFYFLTAIAGRCKKILTGRQKRITKIVWGTDPITNLHHWSTSIQKSGYLSCTWVTTPYSNHSRDDFDLIIGERIPTLIHKRTLLFFLLWSDFDIVCTSFNGFLLGNTKLARIEPTLIHLSGKKIVVIPYGSDAHIYRRHRSIAAQHVLQVDYPDAARRQEAIAKRVSLWVESADAVLPGLMGPNGIGRWDVFAVSMLHVDTGKWAPNYSRSKIRSSTVRIAHLPNHRGVKGTEYVIKVCDELVEEGLKIELDLFQGLKNDEVLKRIRDNADIVVESVTGPGHGLTAVEAMALGKVVISNLDDDLFFDAFRRYSYFSQCPIVSANPETLKETIRVLAIDRNLRISLSEAGRQYAVRYHSYEASEALFSEVFNFVLKRGIRPINFFHPIIGRYSGWEPIVHPLKKNRLVSSHEK